MSSLQLHRAQTFWQRLGGLLIRPRLQAQEALVLSPCSSVHTAFMRYPIDVVFVDKHGRVLKVEQHLKPWRAAWCWGAHAAIELLAGQAQAYGIDRGHQMDWSPA